MKSFIQKKGTNMYPFFNRKRLSYIKSLFKKLLLERGFSENDKDARYALITILGKYSLLTNRQIAELNGISESMVSKILSKEKLTEKTRMLVDDFENGTFGKKKTRS